MDIEGCRWPTAFAPAYTDSRGVIGGPATLRPGNASDLVGASNSPGSTGRNPGERVRIGFLDLVYENWMPFTLGIMSRFLGPRTPTAPWQSPIDVDVSERIQRAGSFPSSERPFPWPYLIGAVANEMPMLDTLSMQWAWGKTPSGPGVMTPIPVAYDITYPTLMKVSG